MQHLLTHYKFEIKLQNYMKIHLLQNCKKYNCISVAPDDRYACNLKLKSYNAAAGIRTVKLSIEEQMFTY